MRDAVPIISLVSSYAMSVWNLCCATKCPFLVLGPPDVPPCGPLCFAVLHSSFLIPCHSALRRSIRHFGVGGALCTAPLRLGPPTPILSDLALISCVLLLDSSRLTLAGLRLLVLRPPRGQRILNACAAFLR